MKLITRGRNELVNGHTAQRLQSAAKEKQIVISADAYEKIKEYLVAGLLVKSP